MAGVKMWEVTLRWGILLGVVGILLTVMGPLIIGNFGTAFPVEGAPVAMGVSILYAVAIVTFMPFSAALVAAALIMRNAEALASHRETADSETQGS
jgi:hypothetical protein